MRHAPTQPFFAVLAALLLAPLAAAQTYATVTQVNASCQAPTPTSATLTLQATPPVTGGGCRITSYGPHMGSAALVLSTGCNYLGFDLSFLGAPGCRLYADPTIGATIGQTLSVINPPSYTVQVPATMPSGFQFFAQSVLVFGTPTTPAWMTSNTLAMRTGIEPDLTPAQIATFAPILRFHPLELYHPMRPMDFIGASRFRHHIALGSDQGFNKATYTWVTTDSHAPEYYGVPVGVINAYGLNQDGTNRRPRDSNCGATWNVFLQPVGAPYGSNLPNGYVSAYYHYRRDLASGNHVIQYWYFCGYNDSFSSVNHQGDWEHVTVWVSSGQVVGAYLAAHNGGTYYTVPQLTMVGGRPAVYAARGSHAAYTAPGSYFGGLDQCADGGVAWDLGNNLQPLATQPWKDYAGAWGEVGSTSTTTGPLGPWHKRNDP